MQPIQSPWHETFEQFVRSIRNSAIVVAPFITEEPLQRFASLLDTNRHPEISILTNFAVDSLLQGSVNAKAIAEFCRAVSVAEVRHLPGLHAKAYIADTHTAIITSGNLTGGSLYRNYEYGVHISDSTMVRRIAEDLREYGSLGASVSIDEIDKLSEIASVLRERHQNTVETVHIDLIDQLEKQRENAHEALRKLRDKPSETTSSIFRRTILYLLRNRPLTTQEIHPLIREIHPDLCDDSLHRVINGIRFGRAWKHRVRAAQEHLKDQGMIELVGSRWRLIQKQ